MGHKCSLISAIICLDIYALENLFNKMYVEKTEHVDPLTATKPVI